MAKKNGNIMAAAYSRSLVGRRTMPAKPKKPTKPVKVNNIMAGYSTSPAQPGSSFNSGFRPVAPGAAPAPGAGQRPAPPTPPAAPKLVDPFLSAEDLQAINDFTTNMSQQLTGIDFNLGNLRTQTAYNETQLNTQATQASSNATDDMIARGLFRSSVKDAALYDIEAQRALQTKFLDDQLTAQVLNAGTQKNLLAESKRRFDTAMAAKKVENAQAINDPLNKTYGDQLTAFYTEHPELRPGAAKPATPPAAATSKPPGIKPPATKPLKGGVTFTGPNTPGAMFARRAGFAVATPKSKTKGNIMAGYSRSPVQWRGF